MTAGLSLWKIGEGRCEALSDTAASVKSVTGNSFIWLDIADVPDQQILNELEIQLGLHEIALDNLFDSLLNPRLLEFEDHLLLGTRVLYPVGQELAIANMGIVIGKGFILTAHDQPLPVIRRTLERVKANASQILTKGPDRLMYLLLDTLVDEYYETLDSLSEGIDQIDDRATELPRRQDISLQRDILETKRKLLALHRAVTPLRDSLLNLRRSNRDLISESAELYLRDVFEHILQLLDTTDTYREILSSTTELIMSAASNRMNEIMTFLTVFTTFFIPINFVASFYGMNLLMPETRSALTYPVVIGLMAVLLALMFVWFKRKKWL